MVFEVVSRILSQNVAHLNTGWDVLAFKKTDFCKELYRGLHTIAVCTSDTDFVWVFNDPRQEEDEFAISHLEIAVTAIIAQVKKVRWGIR